MRKDKKDAFGPWVRVIDQVTHCGKVDDWRKSIPMVHFEDGSREEFPQERLELMTQREYEDFITNPLREKKCRLYIVGT